MTGELIPYGCDSMPMRHRVIVYGLEEIHWWHVVGFAGTLAFRAVRIAELPLLSDVMPRDSQGSHWIGSGIEFHGVAPMLGDVPFNDCPLTGGQCWSAGAGSLQASALIGQVLTAVNRDVQIHRALIAEYHRHVADAWLRSMPEAWPFDDREINEIASDLLCE